MLSTEEVTQKYNVTRQTINNWIKNELITRPNIDNNGWKWTDLNLKELEKAINYKFIEKSNIRSSDTLELYNRRYLGSKQKLIGFIEQVVETHTTGVNSIADIFGGIGSVAHLFQQKNIPVIVNDILYSNYITYLTWFGNEEVDYNKIEYTINELNKIEGINGYVTENFGNKYFSNENARKIDAIREKIETINNFNQREKSFLLTSLIYAADKIANTVGHYDAYRKKMDTKTPIYLKTPKNYSNTNNKIYNLDANELVKRISADLVYIDTPYNSRGYENMYHVLENIAEWKKVPVTGVARKAVNRSEKKSKYNGTKAPKAFEDLIQNINAKYILVSYNNMAKKGNSRSNAKISNEEILSSLENKGDVEIFSTKHLPYSTGKSKITDHKELLYLCAISEGR